MKPFIFILTFIICVVVGFAATGVYPVAKIDGGLIANRTFVKVERAAENFANAEFQKTGMKPVDFEASANALFRRDIGKGTLTFLIEDIIIRREGEKMRDEFNVLVKERVDEALVNSTNADRAARLVYGLSLADFRAYVLMPQARRDIVAEILKEKNQDFAVWMREQKKGLSVSFYFLKFTWTGERVE